MVGISKHDQRYDRQLRLWGDHGQSALEKAKICLIRAGAVGAETLKNLVLPGVGSFTIVDDSCITEDDLSSNFFVCPTDLQKPRARVVTENLLTLNESVSGQCLIEDWADLLDSDQDFFLQFDLIITTDLREGLLLRLGGLLKARNIPLVTCYSVGCIGYLGLWMCEHVIVESHPDATKPDLRLDQPPAGLIQMASEIDLNQLPSEDLVHIPWLIIVHIFVQRFIQERGHFPSAHEEKNEVKQKIKKAGIDLVSQLRDREANLEQSFFLDNFQEAANAVNTAVHSTQIPSEIRNLFDDERCETEDLIGGDTINKQMKVSSSNEKLGLKNTSPVDSSEEVKRNDYTSPTSENFWRMVHALKDFVQNEGKGQLPIRGSLPDMTSDSKRYLRLLSIYRGEFDWAIERLASRLTRFPEISKKDISIFARNAAFLRVIHCRTMDEESNAIRAKANELASNAVTNGDDALFWFIIMHATSSFVDSTGRWPGTCVPYTTSINSKPSKMPKTTDSLDAPFDFLSDAGDLQNHVDRISGSSLSGCSDYIKEMCRFGGGELHSVAAFMGGIAAQEVIKLLTHQFVPINKPLIYNAITQLTQLVDI